MDYISSRLGRNIRLMMLFSKTLSLHFSHTVRGHEIIININTISVFYIMMVSYIKGGMQAKGIWKQDPEANIWVQE